MVVQFHPKNGDFVYNSTFYSKMGPYEPNHFGQNEANACVDDGSFGPYVAPYTFESFVI